MKKILIIVLSSFLIFSVFGFMLACGGGAGEGGGSKKLDFTNITFSDKTVNYSGTSHILGIVTGAPEGTTIVYSGRESQVLPGVYIATATLTKKGYNEKILTAKLTINKIDFTNVTFSDKIFDYDGETHILDEVVGAPLGTSIVYSNREEKTDVGEYSATATLTREGYNDKTLSAKLTINKIDFSNIKFEDTFFEYDGNSHSINVVGTLPSTATVEYSSNVLGVKNSATDIGDYIVSALIKDKNFNDKTLTATLHIETSDEERVLAASGETLFFQNAKDENKLYAYNYLDNKVVKASNDKAKDIIPTLSNSAVYISKSLLSSIKSISYVKTESKVTIESIITKQCSFLQWEGNMYYYCVNGLTNEKSGIYKLDLSGSEPVETCLSEGKAKYLQLVDNKLYFADGKNNYKLSCINTSSISQGRTLVVDKKINNLLYDDGALYFTVNNLLGNYIEKYTISNSVERKLTSDAGIDFVILGKYLYYINVDKINTAIYGNGIYRVERNKSFDNNSSGTSVIPASEEGICSLTSDGFNLYYYDCNGYKLIKYNISNSSSSDILENFVKPEDPAPLSLGTQVEEYNGLVYYLDLRDGKTLHTYNPLTKENRKITSEKVDSFSIIGDYLYLNSITYLVNNNTYRINLKTNELPELINKGDCTEIVSDEKYIYFVEGGKIHKSNMDGSNDVQIYSKSATNLRLVGNKLLFINGNNIHILNLENNEETELKVGSRSIHTTAFDTDGTYIYYRDMYGVAWVNKRLSRCKLDGTDNVEMVTTGTDPISILYYDGYIYYYSDTLTDANNGLYKVSAKATANSTGTLILATNSANYSSTFKIVAGKVYFVNTKDFGVLGDSFLYEIGIDGTSLQKIS